MRKTVLALILILQLISPISSHAIVNGDPAVGADHVVSLLDNSSGTPVTGCSGVYLYNRVVVTAAHCVVANGERAGKWRYLMEDLYVSQTGVDWKDSATTLSMVKVFKISVAPDYYNRWEPENRLFETQINDIAFLFLDKPLNSKPLGLFADKSDIERIRSGAVPLTHFGYGCIAGKDGKIVSNDGKPYKTEGSTGTNAVNPRIPIPERFLEVNYVANKSACPGDSGSPILFSKNGIPTYVGVLFAGSGSAEAAAGTLNRPALASITIFWPYEEFYKKELAEFLLNENIYRFAKSTLEIKRSIAEKRGSYYTDLSACYPGGTKAELQEFRDGAWTKAADALDWEPKTRCFLPGYGNPWTIYEATEGAALRWMYYYQGNWIASNNTYIGKKLIPQTDTLLSLPVNTVGKRKILCVKGKTTKTISGINLVCPKGFKKK
jgi:hypothetical protein